jgi:hypothetical protein
MKSGLIDTLTRNPSETMGFARVRQARTRFNEVKEDIVVALGLSRSLVTGDGPNFATASVSLQKMLVMIREIKQATRSILNWIFNDWLAVIL